MQYKIILRTMLPILMLVTLSYSCTTGATNPVSSPEPAGIKATGSPAPAVSPAVTSAPPNVTASPEGFTVSVEVYRETFDAIKQIIEALNLLIQSRDYKAWLENLSPAYREYFSRPEVLASQNDSKILQSKGIVLKSLEDYFLNVVVPSRANLRLDDISFLNENELDAIMQVGNRRVTVYSLIKISGKWKIGLSRNGL